MKHYDKKSCMITSIFAIYRKSHSQCRECNVSVTKEHLKCHFMDISGDKCDIYCDNKQDSFHSNQSVAKAQPANSFHECSHCSMVSTKY